MTTSPQDPGVLSISFQLGEVWSKLVDFAEPSSLAGYTFAAGLYSVVTGSLVQAITVDVVDEGAAQINLSLTAAQTAAIPAGTYEFRLTWGPVARRVYQGYCEVRA
jgi:hypothetical protein